MQAITVSSATAFWMRSPIPPSVRRCSAHLIRVVLAIFEWSGTSHHEVIAGWRMIRSAADLALIEAAIAARTLPAVRRATALGAALEFDRQMMAQAPPCTEMVIDVSGDGQNNMGRRLIKSMRRRTGAGSG